jgi:hypothetical protein
MERLLAGQAEMKADIKAHQAEADAEEKACQEQFKHIKGHMKAFPHKLR